MDGYVENTVKLATAWVIGVIVGAVGMLAFFMYMSRCDKHTVKSREEMVRGYAYTMIDGIKATSRTRYEVGDLVCL